MDHVYDPPEGPPPNSRGKQRDGEPHPRVLRQLQDVKDYQITHASLLKLVAFEELTKVPAAGVNVTLQPTPWPRQYYDQAISLQHCMNELYIRVDPDYLYSVLKPQIENDKGGLIASLWDVHVKCREAGVVQDVVAGIFRSDYMLHAEYSDGGVGRTSLKQVEMNTYTVAGACHAERVANMHRHLLRVRIAEGTNNNIQANQLPPNTNITSLTAALTAAHNAYLLGNRRLDSTYSKSNVGAMTKPKCVLMPVQPFNFNIVDERPIEYGLWDSGIPCYRCEWRFILTYCRLDADRNLLYQPLGSKTEFEVSVVYYRAGYDPAEYSTDHGRGTRLLLEMSRAIKCPDVLTHLAGFKSVQPAVAEPGVVERFLTSQETRTKRDAVKNTFMPMHVLDDSPAGLQSRKIALDPKQAQGYILKPNLEGGGNNIYGTDISDFLANVIPEKEYHKFILMKLITPPAGTQGALIAGEEVYEGDVVSELGILGFAMWRRGRQGLEVLRNEAAGWTLKTKARSSEEMNVVKGFGAFDCPCLV